MYYNNDSRLISMFILKNFISNAVDTIHVHLNDVHDGFSLKILDR
jgi:hypothetical protein